MNTCVSRISIVLQSNNCIPTDRHLFYFKYNAQKPLILNSTAISQKYDPAYILQNRRYLSIHYYLCYDINIGHHTGTRKLLVTNLYFILLFYLFIWTAKSKLEDCMKCPKFLIKASNSIEFISLFPFLRICYIDTGLNCTM